MSVDVDQLEADPVRRDFRRANGAPLVSDPTDPKRTLRYSRPSGWGKELDDESALVTWRINTAMTGVAANPALQAKIVASMGDKSSMKDLREEATALGRGNEASDIGTALHKMSERYDDPDDDWHAPEPYASRLAMYTDVISVAGLVPMWVEVRVVNDRLRAAGTCDRLYYTQYPLRAPDGSIIPPGTLILGDLKTGKRLDYSIPAYAIQMAIYAESSFYDVETERRTDTPPINQDWGLIVHLPAEGKTCHLVWVDLAVGRVGADLVQQVRAWRKRDDHTQPFLFPEDELPIEMAMVPLEGPEPTGDAWVDLMLPWCATRIAVLGTHAEARAALLRHWPDVPTIKAGGHTVDDVTKILDLLDMIEGLHGFGFPEGDPRAPYRMHKHRSQMHRGNTPPPNTQEAAIT